MTNVNGGSNYQFEFAYGFEAAFAIVMTALLVNLVLLVNIHYGDMDITHNSKRPYIISMFLMGVSLMEISFWLIVANKRGSNLDSIVEDVSNDYTLQLMIYLPGNVKFSLAIMYMMSRIYDRFTLHFFVRIQKNLAVENLDLVKD